MGRPSRGITKSVTVGTIAGANAGSFTIGATASGLLSGSLGAWRDYPAYSYTDRIGGAGAALVTVGK